MRSLVTALALLAGLWLAAPGPAHAQSVGIGAPSHGELLVDTSAFYRPAPYYDVLVSGSVSIPKGQRSKYMLLVHGQRVRPTRASFQARVWVGPWDGPSGPPPSWYPYLGFFRDPQHVQKPIVVELVHKKTKAVVSRDRVVLFDGRFDPHLDPRYGGTTVEDAMHVQLPASGLDALEETHLASLPAPTLAAFNDVLRDAAAGTTFAAETDTRQGGTDKACIPLGDAPTSFLVTSAYVTAFAEAQARFLARQQVQQSQSFLGVGGIPGAVIALGVQAYLTAECVQKQPTLSTWELCVGRVEAELTDLSTAGVSSVNLSYGPGALAPASHDELLADVDLGAIDGVAEGRLRDVFIRWSETPAGCSPTLLPLPQGSVSDTQLLADKERAAWATCEGLEVDAAAAHLGPTTRGPFHVDPLAADDGSAHFDLVTPSDPERVGVTGATGVVFTLDASRTREPDVGTCGEAFVRQSVLDLLDLFYPAMEAALGDAWDEGAADTQQARALDTLLAPFEVGAYEPHDHALDLEYTQLRALEPSHSPTPPYDGLVGTLRTNAVLRPGFEVVPPPQTWVYSAPTLEIVDPDPTDAVIGVASTNGRTLFGQPFDVAFGLTTGTLNQVLRERSATELLRFEWKPTWSDLGLAPPAGAQPDDQAVLDASVLASAVHPGFATLGPGVLTVVAQPTLLPFTWIPPDPFSVSPAAPPFAWGRAPFTYQLSQFLIDVYSTDPLNPHPVQLAIDFYDDELDFSLAGSGSTLLAPQLGAAEWTSTSLLWTVPGCDRAPMTLPSPTAPTCGGYAKDALAGRLLPLLEQNLLEMLADVPAPLRFDAGGAATARRFARSDTFVGGQRIVFYGRLE